MLSDESSSCRVCGLELREAPWGMDGTTPLFDYCPCCGVEFGYQDSTPISARSYRDAWIARGTVWADPDERPTGWDLDEQLAHVPSSFR
jgi:hypothetical protein